MQRNSIISKSVVVGSLLILAGIAALVFANPEWVRVKADVSNYSESFMATLTHEQEVMATSTLSLGTVSTSSLQAASITSQTATSTSSTATSSVLHTPNTGIINLNKNIQALTYNVNVGPLSSHITMAHLHCAPIGENGPVIVPLITSNTGSTSATLHGTIEQEDILSVATTCSPNISTIEHLAQAMREGQIYINVHTVNYPAGEVRGQLVKHASIIDVGFSATSTVPTSSPQANAGQATSTNSGSSTNNNGSISTTSPGLPNTGSNGTSTHSTDSGQATTTHSGQSTSSPAGWYYVFVQPDSYYKIQGSSVRFMGTHFMPGETVMISSGGTNVGTVTADGAGNFTTNWMTVPYVTETRPYTFTGVSSGIPFNVHVTIGSNSPWIVLSNYYAGAGASLTVTGHQFGANEIVNVWFNSQNLGSAQTNTIGDFTFTTSVPPSGQGQYTVRAVGATTNMTATQPFSQSF
jgi:hypothetical protein